MCELHAHLCAAGNPPCTHTTHTHIYTHTHTQTINIYTQKILTMHTHINTHTNTHTHTQAAHTRFNLVACNHYLPLSCLVYGSKLLSCSLTVKVASEMPQCLFQATSCVKDQRHRSFVTSHSAKTSVHVYLLSLSRAATRTSSCS